MVTAYCDECRSAVCPKHVTWDSHNDRWLCTKCARER